MVMVVRSFEFTNGVASAPAFIVDCSCARQGGGFAHLTRNDRQPSPCVRGAEPCNRSLVTRGVAERPPVVLGGTILCYRARTIVSGRRRRSQRLWDSAAGHGDL